MDKSREGPVRLLLVQTAQFAHGRLKHGGFLRANRSVAGGEQPVEFVLGKRAGEPAQQQVRSLGKYDPTERDSEGELEERGRGGAGVLEK